MSYVIHYQDTSPHHLLDHFLVDVGIQKACKFLRHEYLHIFKLDFVSLKYEL